MMGHRELLKGGDEYDAFSRKARRILCSFNRAGMVKKIKKQFNRRIRRQEKEMLRYLRHKPTILTQERTGNED